MEFILLLNVLVSFLISFSVTFYLVPLLASFAHKLGVLDKPDGILKKHEQATPYLGGLAIYIGFITSLALTYPFENKFFLFLVGSTLLLFVGLIDDIIVLKPNQKFFGQIIAAFCFLKAGFYIKESFFSYIPNVLISFFWILSVINAFNLVDVMDGLATTLAIMATLSFILCAIIFGQYSITLFLVAFLGALCAFFWFNKPKAKIYLGDSGSLFIGGLIATVPFMLPWSNNNLMGYFAPIIILLIPILEIGTLVLIRTYKGIPFYKGSPDHFSIFLQRHGWSKIEILGYVTLYSTFLLLLSLSLILNFSSIVTVSCISLFLILIWYLFLCINKDKLIQKKPQKS